jgi:signal transduction histidine kinase
LRRLLEELLDLSRLDAGAVRVDAKPIVLRTVLAQIVHETVPPGTRVELDVPSDLAAVVDEIVLDRVVSNLLSNAARYGAPPVRVCAEQRDRHLRIAVTDEGRGVPEEVRLRLFERFARSGDAGGSGLGLAIARSYARAHGGDIVYEPAEPGARFELVLPQA